MYFNPRTPCGVRRADDEGFVNAPKFQSTHPVWGATFSSLACPLCVVFQSTHPVWGATAWATRIARATMNFNPRTPCGVRLTYDEFRALEREFQSTHPVWGATQRRTYPPSKGGISIHAPRVGCDWESHIGQYKKQ